MHISLDSALGRPPRLIGESITSIASPVAAYSLRSLNGGDPKVVRVRKSGTVTEQDFTASEVASGVLAAFPGSSTSGLVTKWYDQSGQGNDATQTVQGKQPIIVKTDGTLESSSGTPGINFDASNDKFDIPTDLISSINAASGFIVADSDVSSGSRTGLALSGGSFRFYIPLLDGGNFNFGYQDSATKISLGSADTNQHLFSAIAGASTAEAFLDGTSKGSVSSADGKSALSSGGVGAINNGNLWDGLIKEVIIYNTDQSSNRSALETNIMNYYSIS